MVFRLVEWPRILRPSFKRHGKPTPSGGVATSAGPYFEVGIEQEDNPYRQQRESLRVEIDFEKYGSLSNRVSQPGHAFRDCGETVNFDTGIHTRLA